HRSRLTARPGREPCRCWPRRCLRWRKPVLRRRVSTRRRPPPTTRTNVSSCTTLLVLDECYVEARVVLHLVEPPLVGSVSGSARSYEPEAVATTVEPGEFTTVLASGGAVCRHLTDIETRTTCGVHCSFVPRELLDDLRRGPTNCAPPGGRPRGPRREQAIAGEVRAGEQQEREGRAVSRRSRVSCTSESSKRSWPSPLRLSTPWFAQVDGAATELLLYERDRMWNRPSWHFLNGPDRNRTCDLGIKSPLLYRLSYRPAPVSVEAARRGVSTLRRGPHR